MRILSNKMLSLAMALIFMAGTLGLPKTVDASEDLLFIGVGSHFLGINGSGPGWDWNADTNTLTLDSDYTGEKIYSQCAADDTIYINYSGNVTIDGGLSSDGPMEIDCTGSSIDTLLVQNGAAAIGTPKDLVLRGGIISATSSMGNSAFHVRGSFQILGNASIIAHSSGAVMPVLFNDNNTTTINTTGSVEIICDYNNKFMSGTLDYISGTFKTNGTVAVPPSVSDLSDVSIDEGETITRTVNLGEGYFEADSYAVASEDTNIVTTQTDAGNSTFTLEGIHYGTSEVTITWNGGGMAGQTVAMNATVNGKPSVSSIAVPNANVGAQLSLETPAVNENGYEISSQGWEISTDGATNWTAFVPATPMTLEHNGQRLRYFATNTLGTGYSDVVTLTVNPIVDAQTPVFTLHPQSASYKRGNTAAALTVTAGVTDDGTLSYQWYENTKNNNLDGTAILDATHESYTPNINAPGTTYYYCVVTNENTNVNGTQIGKATSNVAVLTVKSASSGSSSSGTNPDKSPTPPVTILPYTQPNQPTIGSAVIKTEGKTLTISDTIMKELLEQVEKAQNGSKYGFGTQIVLDAPTSGLTLTLEQTALNRLTSLKAKSFELKGLPITLTLDTHVLEEIKKQSKGDLTIAVKSVTVEGVNNAYDITFNTVKDGKSKALSEIGSVTLAIPYTPSKDEITDNLYAVYVDEDGNINPIADSFYDANSGSILFNTNHFSIYGVGYEAPNPRFKDIDGHWAKDAIDYAVKNKLLSGTSDATFSPNTVMTRGMLVTTLGRLAGVDTSVYTTTSFTDVNDSTYYAPYIQWAYSKGIVRGIGNSQFAPDQAISRQEMAVIFVNFAKATNHPLPELHRAIAYEDASAIGSAYKTAITAMQQAGVMTGEQNNRFNPTANATRAEACAILYRYIMLTPATTKA